MLLQDSLFARSMPQSTLRLLRFLAWGLSCFFFIWVSVDPQFYDSEGFLAGTACLPVSLGVGLLLLGCFFRKECWQSACWFTLALAGQASSLQLIVAGIKPGFQHYKPVQAIVMNTHPLVLGILALQILLITTFLPSIWPMTRAWAIRTFKPWQVVSIATICVIPAVAGSRQITTYALELCTAAFLQLLNVANITLAVWALPNGLRSWWRDRCVTWLTQQDRSRANGQHIGNSFVLTAALWTIGVTALLAWWIYESHPHIPDEVSYLYQARYFAAGMLTMPAPPVAEAFDIDLMTYEDTRWYSPFPPGWPIALSMGVILGIPWLINPLLAGLNIPLIFALTQRLYDVPTARIAVLLLSTSPWYLFMGMNYMSHMLSLTCALIASLGVVKARSDSSIGWGLTSGGALGFASLIRPLEASILAGLLGLWALGVVGQRVRFSTLAGLALGAALVGSLNFPYNSLLTGDPLKFPVMDYFDKYYGPGINNLGFGPDRGIAWATDPFPGHSFLDAMVNTALNSFSVNTELFGWATGSLIFVAVVLCSRKLQPSDHLMIVFVVAVIAVHALYWFSGGPDFGARYWFLIILPCTLLTIRGIAVLEKTLPEHPARIVSDHGTVLLAVIMLCALSIINFLPWRAIDKYHHYRDMRPDIRVLSHEQKFGKGLVFIKGNRHTDYASAAIYNPIDLDTDTTIYAWARTEQIYDKVVASYPDRPVWVVDGPSLTGNMYKVVAAPAEAYQLLQR